MLKTAFLLSAFCTVADPALENTLSNKRAVSVPFCEAVLSRCCGIERL